MPSLNSTLPSLPNSPFFAVTQSSYFIAKVSGSFPDLAGAETVQVYVADKEASVDRPIKELKKYFR